MKSLGLVEFLTIAEQCIPLVFPLDCEILLAAVDIIAAVTSDEANNLSQREEEVLEWFKNYIKYLGEGIVTTSKYSMQTCPNLSVLDSLFKITGCIFPRRRKGIH